MSHCGPCPSSSESPFCSSGEICQPYAPGLGPRTTSWLSGDLFSFQGAFCFSRLSTECGSGSQVAQRKHAAAVHLESDVVLRANWRNVDILSLIWEFLRYALRLHLLFSLFGDKSNTSMDMSGSERIPPLPNVLVHLLSYNLVAAAGTERWLT